MFEYLAAGRPIVASDLPVLREILTNENAIILPPGDMSAWVETITSLQASDDRRLALSHAARSTAEKYTWHQRAQRVLSGLDG
jgi:glycosyltransferase involved in cell wall biosynthesis